MKVYEHMGSKLPKPLVLHTLCEKSYFDTRGFIWLSMRNGEYHNVHCYNSTGRLSPSRAEAYEEMSDSIEVLVALKIIEGFLE